MKTTATTLLAGLALASSALAGDDYSAKGGKAVVPPPPSCLWTWFAGASVGTVESEWDEEIYTLHVGVERKCPDQSCTHSFFLEIGWTEKEVNTQTNISDLTIYSDETMEIIPITLNYKYECSLNDKINWYVGAGAGVALVDYELVGSIGQLSNKSTMDDTTFYAHIFAGIIYNVTETFELFAGARLIFMDDPFFDGFAFRVDGDTKPGDQGSLDEEIQYEIGGRINF